MVAQTRVFRNHPKASFPLVDLPVVLVYPDKSRRTLGGITDERNEDGLWVRWFHKTIDDKHFLHSPRAIGISKVAVNFLRRARVHMVYVQHKTLGTEYRCTLGTFLRDSFEQRRSGDHDVQMFLPIEYWDIRHPALEMAATPSSLQLDLFEEVKA